MENLNKYSWRAKDARSESKLLGIWRYALLLIAMFSLSAFNTFASTTGDYSKPCTGPCDLRTQTMGGWGAVPRGNNPGAYLHANFSTVFKNGVVVGGGCAGAYTLTLTSADAVTAFLPSGSTASALTESLTDPGQGYQNVLAGQAVALTLSIGFDSYFPNYAPGTPLKDAIITEGTFTGWTVAAVLAEANRALGGCASNYSFSQLNEALSNINESFTDGIKRSDYLVCPLPSPEVKIKQDPSCEGTLVEVKVKGGYGTLTYAWTVPSGATDPGNVSSFTASVAGYYSVTVTDSKGCKGSDKIKVIVWEKPEVKIKQDPACDKDTKLTAYVKGGKEPYTYTWYGPDGNPIGGNTSSIYVSAPGTYKVVVTDANGCKGKDTIKAYIWKSPKLEVDGYINICKGDTYNLYDAILDVSPGVILTYWSGVPGETGSVQLTQQQASMVTAGTYYIVATDKYTKCYTKKRVVIKEVKCEVQGCTLGYWKNHTDRWACYSTGTTFGSVFTAATGDLAGLSLLDALNLGGGGVNNLARQGVAALLNACHNSVSYPLTVTQVKAIVNDALSGIYNSISKCSDAGCAATYLDGLNNSGCPLGGSPATKATATSALQGLGLAESNELRAYPMPFSDKAVIEFTVAQDESFTMRLYDMRGALVRELRAGEAKAGMVNTVEVDGSGLSEGLYIARMVSDSGTKTVKLLKKE